MYLIHRFLSLREYGRENKEKGKMIKIFHNTIKVVLVLLSPLDGECGTASSSNYHLQSIMWAQDGVRLTFLGSLHE